MRTATSTITSKSKGAGFAAFFLLAAALPGWPQSRSGSASARAMARPPIAHAAGRIATPLNPNFAPIHGVPGLGFDYQHLVAVGRAGHERRGGENRGTGRSFITPIFGLGQPYYYAFDTGFPYDYNAPTEQPISEPFTPAIPGIPGGNEPSPVQAEVPALPIVAPIPPPELGQLILMRRYGQVVMAVAFTTSGGRLTYITQDGLRRSFPLAELDADATRQMNDVNGTTVALPK